MRLRRSAGLDDKVKLSDLNHLFLIVITVAFSVFLVTLALFSNRLLMPVNSQESSSGSAQINLSTPTPAPPPLVDSDSDGFLDNIELFVGTDPDSKCMASPSLGNPSTFWPPDLNGDNNVNTMDIALMTPVLNSNEGDTKYRTRFDLNADRKINTPDVDKLTLFLNKHCSQ